MSTIDNKTYYDRNKPIKLNFIKKWFDNNKNKINKIVDVGCNNGVMSYPFQNLGVIVKGYDISDDLNIPSNYDFTKIDITKRDIIEFSDCTMFFSLYHHILGQNGLMEADKVFLKLLLKTEILLFDTGNVSEKNRSSHYWNREQQKYFNNEKELLDHLSSNYNILDKWNVGGGQRSVVSFDRKSIDDKFIILDEFRRKKNGSGLNGGLYHKDERNDLTNNIEYRKLDYNGIKLFAKKRVSGSKYKEITKKEFNNIILIYNLEGFDCNMLIPYYGYSEKYGFIFEWVDDIKVIKRETIKTNSIELRDVELVHTSMGKKYIDFER